jgi:hypothetical protein
MTPQTQKPLKPAPRPWIHQLDPDLQKRLREASLTTLEDFKNIRNEVIWIQEQRRTAADRRRDGGS